MPDLKTLAQNAEVEVRFTGGHSLCRGCGAPTVVRTVLNSISTPVVVVNATGCLEVATTRYPTTAWGVPWMHLAFENAAAAASGLETAYRALKKRGAIPDEPITFIVFGGDGGTYDIGLQALSGALERGHRFMYVCYDNEAYMNTGIQRSGATPFAASTTTSPSGRQDYGKHQERKDISAIAIAHHIPYVAQAAMSHWQDLSDKALRASQQNGPSFLNVLSGCALGWGHSPADTIEIVRLAVETRYWPLYEVVNGHYWLNYEPKNPPPIEEWLTRQDRFKHLFQAKDKERLGELQTLVDSEWEGVKARASVDAGWFEQRPELKGTRV